MRRVLLLGLVALFLPSFAQGKAAETFSTRKVGRFEPVAWDLYTLGATYKDVMTKSGLQYYEYIKPTKPTALLNYLPVLEQLVWDADLGAWIIFSHGDSLGATTFEAYGGDAAGQALQAQALQSYVGPYSGEIMSVDIPDPAHPGKYFMHGIGVTPLFFSSRWYTPPDGKVFVDMRTCFGSNMRSGFPGATFSGYDCRVTNLDEQKHQNSLYLSMGGVTNGVRGRVLRNAISGQPSYWHIYGDLDLTLCPAVVAQTPTKESLEDKLDVRKTVRVTFDTKIAWPSDGTSIMFATGAAYIYNVEAESDTTLLFALTGTQKAAWGTVDILSGMDGSFWNGITGFPAYTGLDGNGVYPNGDDYTFEVYSMLGDNPAANVYGFTVTRSDHGVIARWLVQSETNTAAYILEYAPSPTDSFVTVAEVTANGSSVYEVPISGLMDGFYRLRERETSGNMLTHAYASVDDPRSVTTDSVMVTDDYNDRYQSPNVATQILTSYTDVIYSPLLFQVPAQDLANYQTSINIPTVVALLENVPGGAAGIKADFAARISNGARNMLLFGDGNEDHDAQGNLRYNNPAVYDSGYAYPGSTPQPQNDIIPVAAYPMDWGYKASSMPYWTKYHGTDWAYIDLDGDGKPDPGLSVGRYPATTLDEAQNLANKGKYAHQINFSSPGVNHVFAFTYAFDVLGNSGADVKADMDSILAYLPPRYVVDRYTDEPTHWYTNPGRDALAVSAFNQGDGLHIYNGTTNNFYNNAQTLDQARQADLSGFITNPTKTGFLLVLACGGGDFDRTEITAIGRPLNERLTENRSDFGAWGYLGPNRGSWRHGNLWFAEELFKQLFWYGAPSIGQATARAIYALETKHPEMRALWESYILLAPPSVKLAGQVVNTTAVDSPLPQNQFALAPPAPNPSHRTTTIEYSLPSASIVDIGLYDVQGRRVRRIDTGAKDAGPHRLQVQLSEAPGEYFLRVAVGDKERVQKLVVIH